MSSQGEGLTATDARGQPSQVRSTLHVLLRLELPLGDSLCRRQTGSPFSFLLHFVRLFVDVTFFIPIHDYILASSPGLKSFVGAKDLTFIVMILYEDL